MRNVTTLLGSAAGFMLLQIIVLLAASGGDLSATAKEPSFAALIYGSGAIFGALIGGIGLLSTKLIKRQTSPLAFRLSTAFAAIVIGLALNVCATYTGTATSLASVLALVYNISTMMTMAPFIALGLNQVAALFIGTALVGWLIGAAGWYAARLVHGKQEVA